MKAKNIFYISSFTFLGILIQFIIHGLVERLYIHLLLTDFETFSLGFSWEAWFSFHYIFAGGLFIAGFFFGLWQGTYWWTRIYGHDRKKK